MDASSLISINPTDRSGRFLFALQDLNDYAADPTYGVPEDEIRKTWKDIEHWAPDSANSVPDSDKDTLNHIHKDCQVSAKASGTDSHKDLVAKLIRDENKIWTDLLSNKFCQEMKNAAKSDIFVKEGFQWYMIQDFLYCGKLMVFDTERSTRAPTMAKYEELSKKIQSHARYANDLLKTCTKRLNIDADLVLGAKREWETKQYTEFTINVAEHFDWVASLVAMIPCIQSYYKIALDLKTNSTHKDTIWYKHWVQPNANEDAKGSTEKQKAFFVANYDSWRKISYPKLRKIFREACQREIDLWGVGEEPGTVNKWNRSRFIGDLKDL